MKILILGATGATGSLVVRESISRGIRTKIVVRNIAKLPDDIRNNNLVECITGNIAEFGHEKFIQLISDCDAVISCLGHNISLKGMFGEPRLLVTNAVINTCRALNEVKKDKVKLILMNTTGNMNTKIKENYSSKDKMVLNLLYHILPPQKDNVEAAKYLVNTIGENDPVIEWAAVRPDTLLNEENVSRYEVFESPKRSPIFNAGKTSRINVSHFMHELLTNEELWEKWKYKMPVIYNVEK